MKKNSPNKNYQIPGNLPDKVNEQLISLYLKHTPTDLSTLEDAAAEGDTELAYQQCHKLLSNMKIMGFNEIVELLTIIECEKCTGPKLLKRVDAVSILISESFHMLSSQKQS